LQESLAREQSLAQRVSFILKRFVPIGRSSAAQANVKLAEALLKLAQDQRNAGVATGIDVTRAQTRWRNNKSDWPRLKRRLNKLG